MPIYEYKCKNCESQFELIRFSHDKDNEIECPKCGEKKVEKVMSVTGSASSSGVNDGYGTCLTSSGGFG